MINLCLTASLLMTAAGPADLPELKDAYGGQFLIGTCVSTQLPQSEAAFDLQTRSLIARQFNAITPENTMKWGNIHPEPDRYDWEAADAFVAFGQQHGMALFGHTLVWHNRTPDWVFEDADGKPVAREILIERMQDHIATVVGRYRGKLRAWDVVNEALENSKDQPLRQSKWLKIIGEDYLDIAYRAAHEADPDAILLYNDYGWDDDQKRANGIALLKGMLERGVPVHAVGLQGHWRGFERPDAKKLQRMLDEIGELGLPMHITELDMSIYEWNDRENRHPETLPSDLAAKQASHYAAWFRVFRANSDRLARVSFWGPNDRYTWLNNFPVKKRPDHPLLFDKQNRPKPAFHAVIKAAQGE